MKQSLVATAILTLITGAPLAAQSLKPGQWQMTSTVTNAQMPEAPPQVIEMMKKPHSLSHCMTPQEAAAGPKELMKVPPNCKVSRYDMAGGRMNIAMACSDPHGGGAMQMTSTGTFTPTTFSAMSHMVVSAPGGRGQIITDAKTEGHWQGVCTK